MYEYSLLDVVGTVVFLTLLSCLCILNEHFITMEITLKMSTFSKRHRMCYRLYIIYSKHVNNKLLCSVVISVTLPVNLVMRIFKRVLTLSVCWEFEIAYHHNLAVKRNASHRMLMMLNRPNDFYANSASDTALLRQ